LPKLLHSSHLIAFCIDQMGGCRPDGPPSSCHPDISIFFTSATTVIITQIINLSILTTIFIVLSTAGTLWGSQEKIKAGIALVKAKLCAKKQEVDVTSMHQAEADMYVLVLI
jgi:hypothetical protein